MASKSENSEIAVLQTQMEDVKDALVEIKTDNQRGFDDIKAQLSLLGHTYLTRGEFETYKTNLVDTQAPGKKLMEDIRDKVVTALVWGTIVGLILVLITYFNYTVLRLPQQGSTPTQTTPAATSGGSAPSASATSNASATPTNPTATDSQSSGGSVTVPLPKLP